MLCEAVMTSSRHYKYTVEYEDHSQNTSW